LQHDQYVPPSCFKSNLKQYYKRAEKNDIQVISIAIASPTAQLQEANPHIDIEIKKYNNIYKDLADDFRNVRILEPYDPHNVEQMMIDDHHPNALGHEYIFNSIKELL